MAKIAEIKKSLPYLMGKRIELESTGTYVGVLTELRLDKYLILENVEMKSQHKGVESMKRPYAALDCKSITKIKVLP